MRTFTAILMLCTVGQVSAFAPAAPSIGARIAVPRPPLGSALQSAKVLPVAYASASAALLYRTTKVISAGAAINADAAVLTATAMLALFNLGPSDNMRLASAKKADKNYPPAVSGVAKQRRQAAKTWRSVVRIKLIGQMVGLVSMALAKTSTGRLRGAAMVMFANTAFFLCGAGPATHNKNGESAPMSSRTSRAVLTVDTILTACALLAASSPLESVRRVWFAGTYAVGASIGALEGVANLVSKK